MAILNNSPVPNLSEIIVELFDNELLSDVIFSCGENLIYAHSFLLMSRSVVYETELRSNQGVQNFIPIEKYDYETFYEFIRFIYTDTCKIKQNVMPLLELSVKYKITKLENMVIACVMGSEMTVTEKFKIFEFCETENYQLLRNWICRCIGPLIPDIINSDDFTSIQPNLLESILKMDFIGTVANPVKEVDLFNALVKWMNHYCTKNGIALSERRLKFDGLIRLIRFPIMVFADLSDCIKKSDNLFTDSDYVTFFTSELGGMWNCAMRHLCPIENQKQADIEETQFSIWSNAAKLRRTHKFVTANKYSPLSSAAKLGRAHKCISCNKCIPLSSASRLTRMSQDLSYRSVSLSGELNYGQLKPLQLFETTEKLIIAGLRLRFTSRDVHSIQLESSNDVSQLLRMQVTPTSSFELIVSFGESIVLQPGCQYRIVIDYANNCTTTPTEVSDSKIVLVHNDFLKYYKEVSRDSRLVEIFFKMP